MCSVWLLAARATSGHRVVLSGAFYPSSSSPLHHSAPSSASVASQASSWLAVLVSLKQIYMHLSYYNKPEEQKWIVRIVFMVPIYSICSWLSLRYYEESVYIDGVRNVYEALVIYYFLSLCYQFIGGESAILAQLGQDAENKPRCLTCTCCLDPFAYDLNFLRYCKQGCLQFCIIKPVMSVIAMIAHSMG